ncbi:hypothetical protein HUJ05_007659 [Dendroctonus ponderosae]|nr:hypothetical protein HUJ05_007659 [Dendroctonus ponderosae]
MYGMAKPLADSIGATVVKVGTTTTTTTTEMVCLYGFERTIGQKIAVLVLRAGFCIVDHRYFHSVVSRNNSPEQKKNPVFDLEDAANIQIKLKFDPKDVLAERGSSELLRAYESVAVHMPLIHDKSDSIFLTAIVVETSADHGKASKMVVVVVVVPTFTTVAPIESAKGLAMPYICTVKTTIRQSNNLGNIT